LISERPPRGGLSVCAQRGRSTLSAIVLTCNRQLRADLTQLNAARDVLLNVIKRCHVRQTKEEAIMKKIIMVVGLATLLASAAFAQAPQIGTGNQNFPGDPAAAKAAGAWSGIFVFPGAASGATGAFAYEPPTAQDCARRFKSYNPRSGTYLGRDGYRHACP